MPKHLWLDEQEQQVWRAYVRAVRLLFAEIDRELQTDAGMPRTQFQLLFLLAKAPGRSLRMSDLAEATSSLPSSITHTVSRLEEAGLVRREMCSTDRRGWFAVLTDEGRAALRQAAPHHANSIRTHLFEQLTATQLDQLRQISETLLAHLTADDGLDAEVAR